MAQKNLIRCAWAHNTDALMQAYHDYEWGRPCHDDTKLFEFLCLEGQQAGLSWQTVLVKRQAYRQAFYNFNIEYVANMRPEQLAALEANKDLIRHSKKLHSIYKNARAAQKIQARYASLDQFFWSYVDGWPIINRPKTPEDVPAKTERSIKLAKDLKKLGFSFVGPTTCYAFMQAAGMVNDHLDACIYQHFN